MDSQHPSIWKTCKDGFRRNRFPGLVLQGFAGTLVLLYAYVEPARLVFQQIGEFKQSTDPWFAGISTAFFAGFIPWCVLKFRNKLPPGQAGKQLVFYLIYWTIQGATVDFLYQWQTRWFGAENDFKTLALKTLVDQGPYNMLYATPVALLFFSWKEEGFSWKKLRANHSARSLLSRYATIQMSVWIVWIPAVMMIYSLPPDLQIPLFNLVICFFSLLLIFVSRGG